MAWSHVLSASEQQVAQHLGQHIASRVLGLRQVLCAEGSAPDATLDDWHLSGECPTCEQQLLISLAPSFGGQLRLTLAPCCPAMQATWSACCGQGPHLVIKPETVARYLGGFKYQRLDCEQLEAVGAELAQRFGLAVAAGAGEVAGGQREWSLVGSCRKCGPRTAVAGEAKVTCGGWGRSLWYCAAGRLDTYGKRGRRRCASLWTSTFSREATRCACLPEKRLRCTPTAAHPTATRTRKLCRLLSRLC